MQKHGYISIDVAKESMEVPVHEGKRTWDWVNNENGLNDETQKMGTILMRRRQVVTMLTSERNLLYQDGPIVRGRIKENIDFLERELDDITKNC